LLAEWRRASGRRCIQGFAEAQQLRLGAAERYYNEASQLANQHVGPNSIAAALPASLLSRIRYEQGRVEECEAVLVDRLPLISAGAMLECVLSAYLVMVRAAAFRMNFDRAYTLLERAENLGMMRDWGRLCAAAALERVWLHVREGRLNEGLVAHERLQSLAEKYDPSIDFAWSEISRYADLAGAYLASAQGRFEDAIATLTNLRADAERVHDHYFGLRVAVHLSTARFNAGRTTEALGELDRLLSVSVKAGVYQIILDEGPNIGPLQFAG
jgi:LuxR family transcriptional regulator, maltose regulon positive regulatory protein